MAVLRTIHCNVCGETKREARAGGDVSSECYDCQRKESSRKRREHLAGLKGLTVEERLERIEAWIYDYKPPVNPRDIVFG